MGIFTKKEEQISILQKTQESLDLTQKSLSIMFDKISQTLEKTSDKENGDEFTEEERIRAAYALNLCTVSVSQIIDYNDLNILEQEYDAILNNLNLEYIPKDEALLNTLKLLLDTITFFRIQEGDKQFIDREYQQKMKNAIWSAVPNFGVIIANGNPWTMATSLASQVGIGYMNYRKAKAENQLDKEKAEWQLQRAAIEQFNGIRRELFDAAWRLADKYKFADRYRLTERQIKQYNNILMDADDYRRFERLDAIKDNFEAYPPFWYFIGNAANLIAQNELDMGISMHYQELAKACFEKFLVRNKYALLREDQVTSSCCLEYIDLLDEDKDKEKIGSLLDKAVKASGNANDIIELCALYYLKIGNINQSALLFRQLINEDYNTIVNAQILSNIYVFDYINGKSSAARYNYKTLERKVDSQFLFPMPLDNGLLTEELNKEFVENQRRILLKKYALVLERFIEKYTITFNKIFPVPDSKVCYDDTYYLDTNDARKERVKQIKIVLANKHKTADYISELGSANISFTVIDILNQMFDTITFLNCVENPEQLSIFIKMGIDKNRENLNKIQLKIDENQFGNSELEILQSITLESFTELFFDEMVDDIKDYVNKKNTISEFSYAEKNLREFCLREGISEPDILFSRSENYNSSDQFRKVYFSPELLGEEAAKLKREMDISQEMIKRINQAKGQLLLNDEKTSFLVKGENSFEIYLNKLSSKFDRRLKQKTLAVLDECKFRDKDLIFTTTGVILVVNNSLKAEVPYREISWTDNNCNELKIKEKYKSKDVDLQRMYELIQMLGMYVVSEESSMSEKLLELF